MEEKNELVDLPLAGRKFTWTNNQGQVSRSSKDRFLIIQGMGGSFFWGYQVAPLSHQISDSMGSNGSH